MAMLAEPRRKQKWTLNPRGKHWSEDSNKYGQRMLEKMGWTTGKGLGVNEQGMTEHVRVSLKNDTAGVGFKMEDLDKAWTEYQEGFNDLLQELQKCQNSGSDDVVEIPSEAPNKRSLEMKSKQSRVRVHYQKFARGKDVNRYSSKDLANIFGQKELSINNKDKENTEKEVEEAYQNEPIGTQDTTSGVVTINSGNMTDYFKKMGGTYHKTFENNKDSKLDDSDCEITYAGFGFASAQNKESAETTDLKKSTCTYGFENPCLDLGSTEEVVSVNETVKASKKRKKDFSLHNEPNLNNQFKKLRQDVPASNHINGFVNAGLNLDSGSREAYNGKEFEVSRAEFGLANSALDITDEIKETKRVTFNDHVEYSDDSTKKKKGKATLDKFEVENKKQKRKRKQENSHNGLVPNGFVNEALEVHDVAEEINDNEVNERKSKKAKKRKESRRSNLETILEAPDEDKETHEEPSQATDVIITQDSAADFNTDVVLDEHLSGKKHKKKKKKENAKEENTVDNIGDQISINETRDINDPNETKDGIQIESIKRQKKEKKKKKKEKNLNDNIHLAETSQEYTILDEQITKTDKNVDVAEEQPIERHDKFRISLKKGKKKKKKKEILDLAVTAGENLDSEIQGIAPEEKTTSELPEETQEPKAELTEDVSAKEKKKKKKKLKSFMIEEGLDNSNKEEVSDKENTKIDKEELQLKKSKKSKESKKNKSAVLDANTSETEQVQQEHSDIQNHSQNLTDSESTPSKKSDDNNDILKFMSSPWNEKARMSKKLLKSLFQRNIISNFPGSNIHDIKGYGVDI